MAEKTSSSDQYLLGQSCRLDGVRLTELIGTGSYAQVYRGEWNGIRVAVKKLHHVLQNTSPQEKDGLTKVFYKELGMNMELRHPNIIQFLGIVFPQSLVVRGGVDDGDGEDYEGALSQHHTAVSAVLSSRDEFPMMVMELMHCTLDDRLAEYRKNGAQMPFCEAVDTASDIAAALVYLHGRNPPIAHRDLAPKNILLSAAGTAKLCDLGLAKWARKTTGPQKNTVGPGTLPYMPPEVRLGGNYSLLEVDLYSFGVTLLEMSSGQEPNPTEFTHMKEDGSYTLVDERRRRKKSFAALRRDCPLLDTIDQCLQRAVSTRPTAKNLLSILQKTREGKEYLTSKDQTTAVAKKQCCTCENKEKELTSLQATVEEQEGELARLRETNKHLESFREEQLEKLRMRLELVAVEGERYQLQLREVQDALDHQIQANRRLETTNDLTMDINQLLKQKVEMDSQLARSPHHCPLNSGNLMEKGVSLRYPSEMRPKPVPKPRRKRRESSHTASSKSTEELDTLVAENKDNDSECGDQDKKKKSRRLYRSSGLSASVSCLPIMMDSGDGGGAGGGANEATYLQLDDIAMVKAQKHNKIQKSQLPHSSSPKKRTISSVSYVNPDDPVYVHFPVAEPPTPPPREQEFRFSSSVLKRASSDRKIFRPCRLSVISESSDEGTKLSPGPRNRLSSQSMRSPRRPAADEDDYAAQELQRQKSRGDILISEVVSSVKTKGPGQLSVKKGELVKVINRDLDKKSCVAVTTHGVSGTLRKKHIQQVSAVNILYDQSNTAWSIRSGVINHIARSTSPYGRWISPIVTTKITIVPSSLHSGDAENLMKMTEYLLCCTNDDEESKFDIDLCEQRLLRLSGYVLQCHPEGHNGAPVHWTMEGSHNGRTWSHLSEASGDYFCERNARYFPVTNPSPCRYFRLTQLEKNTAGNHRFCLSGLELYGQLYSSVPQERQPLN